MTATIAEFVSRVGDVVSPVSGPADAIRAFSSVGVWDGADPEPAAPGSLLFATGVTAGLYGIAFRTARQADCAAVVLREPSDASLWTAWMDSARHHGIPLLLLRRSASWLAAIDAASELAAADPSPSDTTGGAGVGDLFALADVFADMVGGPVIIEDANFHVLAYSSFTGDMDKGRDTAILGRSIPADWLDYLEKTGNIERLRTTFDVVDLASGPSQAHRRLITSVRSTSQLLGILWVAEGGQPLPPQAGEALRQAAALAVPHLLRHQEGHRAQRMWRGNLVRSLVEGRGQLHRHADELGLPRRADFVVLAFVPIGDGAVSDEAWDRVVDHVGVTCEAFRRHAAVARVGGTVFALVALPNGATPSSVLRLGQEITNRSVPALRQHLCGAASTVGPGLGQINQRRVEAEDALNIVRQADPDHPRFVGYGDVQASVVLRELAAILDQRSDLRLPGLRTLAEEDRRRGSDYLATLCAYLTAGRNAGATARQMDIHVTTLRYRLSRIREICGLDLDDPPVRLVCEFLLRADLI
jgi:sugar diacid utilization regulator